jgi:hypothetical protein
MTTVSKSIAPSIRRSRALILLGTLAALVTTVACSSNSKPNVNSSQPAKASVQPVSLKSALPSSSEPMLETTKASTPEKTALPKLISYKSRDYGVSFAYPRQYAYLSAKAVANGDATLQPKSDGYDGQFTLARIDVPKGFYPDTDFESGYFVLSLNQDISQEECEASLNAGKDSKVQTQSINGVDFKWLETDSGGRGASEKLRNFVSFTNGTCYELEMGVKTRNEDGLAREVDPDQVLRRLDGILMTVKIQPDLQKSTPQMETSAETQKPVAQN